MLGALGFAKIDEEMTNLGYFWPGQFLRRIFKMALLPSGRLCNPSPPLCISKYF
jgi:hypothetical protein